MIESNFKFFLGSEDCAKHIEWAFAHNSGLYHFILRECNTSSDSFRIFFEKHILTSDDKYEILKSFAHLKLNQSFKMDFYTYQYVRPSKEFLIVVGLLTPNNKKLIEVLSKPDVQRLDIVACLISLEDKEELTKSVIFKIITLSDDFLFDYLLNFKAKDVDLTLEDYIELDRIEPRVSNYLRIHLIHKHKEEVEKNEQAILEIQCKNEYHRNFIDTLRNINSGSNVQGKSSTLAGTSKFN